MAAPPPPFHRDLIAGSPPHPSLSRTHCHVNSLSAHTQTRTNKQYNFICITFSTLSTIAIQRRYTRRVECTRIQTHLLHRTVFCILQISVSTTLNCCRSSKSTLSVSMCVCVCLYCRLNVLHDRRSPLFGFSTRYLHRHLLRLPYPVYLILRSF